MLLSDRDLPRSPPGGWGPVRDDTLVQPWFSTTSGSIACFGCSTTLATPITDPASSSGHELSTSLVQLVDGGTLSVLHPGEFVLGSTLELFTLPDNLAGRLEGKFVVGWAC